MILPVKVLIGNEWKYGEVVHTDKIKFYTGDRVIEIEENEICKFTGRKDKNGTHIYTQDIVKIPTTHNKDFHGEYAYFEVIEINGVFVVSYLKSEKGFLIPRGHLRSLLLDEFTYDGKLFLWSEQYELETDIEIVGNIQHKEME